MRNILTTLAAAAILAAPAAAQRPIFDGKADGQVYPTRAGAWAHAAQKAALAAGTDLALRKLGVSPRAAAIAAGPGTFLVAKAIEVAGFRHTLGPRDALFDLGWHLGGVALVRGHPGGLAVSFGLIVANCRQASPTPAGCR